MADIPPGLYALYRANLRRNHNRKYRAAQLERPYLWLIWSGHGLAYILGRVQQKSKYETDTRE